MSNLGPDAFDFWLGEWDCSFDGGHAVNSVTREFGGAVIREDFMADQPRSWRGMSVSVHDETAGWRQTWVDESGNYWAFAGSLVEGDPSFGTTTPVDAENRYKRMVFSDITADGFAWRWESSPDRETWTVDWQIRYRRRPT